MKILKIFGVVVGIHVFALMLIFVNPGCSSTAKQPPAPSDTVRGVNDSVAPTVMLPPPSGAVSPVSAMPDEPGMGVRFSPTRPGTAAASTLDATPVVVTPASAYTVARGDSLWVIAHRNHLTVDELAKANNLKTNAPVRLGQKLIIPGKSGTRASPAASSASAAKSAAPTPQATGQTVKHIVKPGETLGGIARKYQVKVGEIATANNISDPAKIRPGQELIIPGWQAPASHAAKPAANVTVSPVPSEPAPAAPADSVVQPAPDSGVVQPAPHSDSEPPVIPVQDDSAPTQF